MAGGTRQANVLLIDNDQLLLAELTNALQGAGICSLAAQDGISGLRAFHANRPDAVILDSRLPRMDGWTVASRIREISNTPLVMLVSNNGDEESLRAFSLGADDCVTKPISCSIMTVRVSALLKRNNGNGSNDDGVFVSGDLTIDFSGRRATRAGRVVDLTPTEFQLLKTLARHAGRPLSHDYLLGEVWGHGYEQELEYIRRYVWSLRKKLEDNPSSPTHLLTERSFGYRFE